MRCSGLCFLHRTTGKPISTTGSLASTVGVKNPYRYRGYRYDTETSLYYLNSRYYDPEIKRFINADAFTSTGQGILGNNMFAYCQNNPVRYRDTCGYAVEEAYDEDGILDNGLIGDTAGGGGGSSNSASTVPAVSVGSVASPNFVVIQDGIAIPVPPGAKGPVNVQNKSGNTTGFAYTGATSVKSTTSGFNSKVDGVRIMDPTVQRGNAPAYPNGYAVYINATGQKVYPDTGRTGPNNDVHFSLVRM